VGIVRYNRAVCIVDRTLSFIKATLDSIQRSICVAIWFEESMTVIIYMLSPNYMSTKVHDNSNYASMANNVRKTYRKI